MAKTKRTKPKQDKKMKLIICLLLAVVLVNALYYAFSRYEGISGYGDDPTYLYLASTLVHGNFMISPGFIFSVRLTEAYAIAIIYYLFGISTLTSTLWNIISYIGIIIVTFYLAKFVYNEKAGVIAAFLVSIFPLVTKYAVTVGEDIPLAFLASLAILLFLYAERDNRRWMYFFSGMLLVLVWLTSVEGVIIIIFLFLYAFIELLRGRIRIDRSTIFFLYGIAFLFLIVFIFSYINSGYPFITITENTRFYSAVNSTVGGLPTIPSANTDLNFYIDEMFQYNMIRTFTAESLGNAINNMSGQLFGQILNYEYGLYFYLVFPILILLLLFREKRSYFMIAWFLFGFLFLEIGPMHVGITLSPFHITYLLAHRLIRLMLIVAVPLSAIIAIGLTKLLEAKNKYLLALGVVAVIAMLALLYANNYYIATYWYLWQHYPAGLVMQAANFLKGVSPTAHIYLEAQYNGAGLGYSAGAIETYLGNPSGYRVNISISSATNCSAFAADSYIIWSGLPKCAGWTNVLNLTTPTDIPQYIVVAEQPLLGYKPTNIYYINS